MVIEELLRELTPHVLGPLVRRYGGFDMCEDAVQEALLAAAVQWPVDGVPDNPRSWLITVASRRRIELLRSDAARQRREETVAAQTIPDPDPPPAVDDTLTLLLLCCHPSLTAPSQVALTLRAVGGLTTAEIGRAFLVPEATIAQRISRAKAKIKSAGAEFRLPPDAELTERLSTVLHVLYLVFNEGYTASSGDSLHRVELSAEAIRLTRQVHERLTSGEVGGRPSGGVGGAPPSGGVRGAAPSPGVGGAPPGGDGGRRIVGEVAGLLALMLLTDARRPARTSPDGALIPLPEQDRTLWDIEAIAEGTELISSTLRTAPIGPYQLQAAIAAVHAEATRAEDTDWRQILVLYELLETMAPGPMVTLNRIVAVAMVHGPQAGLDQLESAAKEPALAEHYRVDAVRAHLLELAGEKEAAREAYRQAARRTESIPEQRYLESRANT